MLPLISLLVVISVVRLTVTLSQCLWYLIMAPKYRNNFNFIIHMYYKKKTLCTGFGIIHGSTGILERILHGKRETTVFPLLELERYRLFIRCVSWGLYAPFILHIASSLIFFLSWLFSKLSHRCSYNLNVYKYVHIYVN